MTTRAREAYCVACDHAGAQEGAVEQREATVTTTTSRRSKPQTDFQETARTYEASLARRQEVAAQIRRCEDLFHDGLHYYYAHRLDKAHLRSDGSQHLRYRRALRALRLAAQAAANLPDDLQDRTLKRRVDDLKSVVKSFCHCARRSPPMIPHGGAREYSAYRHLAKGIEHLDGAICAALFPDLKIGGSPWTPGGRLSLSFHELMLVFTTYRVSPWLEETAARLELLDAFAEYTAHR